MSKIIEIVRSINYKDPQSIATAFTTLTTDFPDNAIWASLYCGVEFENHENAKEKFLLAYFHRIVLRVAAVSTQNLHPYIDDWYITLKNNAGNNRVDEQVNLLYSAILYHIEPGKKYDESANFFSGEPENFFSKDTNDDKSAEDIFKSKLFWELRKSENSKIKNKVTGNALLLELEQLANNGCPAAIIRLCWIYLLGDEEYGITPDNAKAYAQLASLIDALFSPQLVQCVKILLDTASSGSINACFLLEKILLETSSRYNDRRLRFICKSFAIHFLEAASNLGDLSATYKLGCIYAFRTFLPHYIVKGKRTFDQMHDYYERAEYDEINVDLMKAKAFFARGYCMFDTHNPDNNGLQPVCGTLYKIVSIKRLELLENEIAQLFIELRRTIDQGNTRKLSKLAGEVKELVASQFMTKEQIKAALRILKAANTTDEKANLILNALKIFLESNLCPTLQVTSARVLVKNGFFEQKIEYPKDAETAKVIQAISPICFLS